MPWRHRMFGVTAGEVVMLLLIGGAVTVGIGLLLRRGRPYVGGEDQTDSSRATSLRVMVVGCAVVGLGVLLLFLPTSTSYQGTRLECGSAFAPDTVNEAAYDCGTDERRFAAVAAMTGGAFAALVAGLWPALRGSTQQQRRAAGAERR